VIGVRSERLLLDQSDGIGWGRVMGSGGVESEYRIDGYVRTCSRECGGDGSPSRRSVVGSLPVVGVGGGEGLPAEVGERGERGGAALCTSHQRRILFYISPAPS